MTKPEGTAFCMHCKLWTNAKDMNETSGGSYCCEGCLYDYCERCLERTADCELGDDYVCQECYEHAACAAYDYMRGD